MRAYTISGMRFGSGLPGPGSSASTSNEAASVLALTSTAMAQAMAQAQAAAAAANQNADIPLANLSLATGDYLDSSSYPEPKSKTPLIIGGIAAVVLGVGGYFLLRKKGKR